jgi:hypothetical protein
MKFIQLISILLIISTCGNEAVVHTLPDPVPDQEIHSSEEGLSLTLASRRYIYWFA